MISEALPVVEDDRKIVEVTDHETAAESINHQSLKLLGFLCFFLLIQESMTGSIKQHYLAVVIQIHNLAK